MLQPRSEIWCRFGGWVRDGWLIVGLAVGLLLGAELLYRARGAVRDAIGRIGHAETPRGPYADSAWYPEYLSELQASFRLQWTPYVYFRRALLRGKYINVDSLGHRLTIEPPVRGGVVRHVFFFGGSTMFGTYQRDAWTIPSVSAARLGALGRRDVDVTNFGETGYVFTQELLRLLLELRNDARPDVVVFYDGINEVAAAVQDGRAGLPQNEVNREREFELGRRLLTPNGDFRSELNAFTALVQLAASRSQLVARLAELVRRRQIPERNSDSLALQLAGTYARTAHIVEALSQHYGFEAVYFWQPTLFTTRKPLTPYERSLLSQIEGDAFQRRLEAVHVAVRQPLEAAMRRVAPHRFADLGSLFADDTGPVFMDAIGHTTEAANGPIVEAIMGYVAPALSHRATTR